MSNVDIKTEIRLEGEADLYDLYTRLGTLLNAYGSGAKILIDTDECYLPVIHIYGGELEQEGEA